jgi:hypothetical protein
MARSHPLTGEHAKAYYGLVGGALHHSYLVCQLIVATTLLLLIETI